MRATEIYPWRSLHTIRAPTHNIITNWCSSALIRMSSIWIVTSWKKNKSEERNKVTEQQIHTNIKMESTFNYDTCPNIISLFWLLRKCAERKIISVNTFTNIAAQSFIISPLLYFISTLEFFKVYICLRHGGKTFFFSYTPFSATPSQNVSLSFIFFIPAKIFYYHFIFVRCSFSARTSHTMIRKKYTQYHFFAHWMRATLLLFSFSLVFW